MCVLAFILIAIGTGLALGTPLLYDSADRVQNDDEPVIAFEVLQFLPIIRVDMGATMRPKNEEVTESGDTQNALDRLKDELERNSYALYKVKSCLESSTIEETAMAVKEIITNLKLIQEDLQKVSVTTEPTKNTPNYTPLDVELTLDAPPVDKDPFESSSPVYILEYDFDYPADNIMDNMIY